ncbi:NADH:ubiquinone oxidoreductase subunit S6 [Phyllostomus discolor]|uniref:NADH:ubiquinone oxidoreductase subunit S6 n=1 Tax=Phyllostomus discolor TaxID=89673 RepID=A0A834BBA0_9CHIR|nr:NADH:ubiquinone oxidoreductase subunit S6 [Phyllostomus discolor]
MAAALTFCRHLGRGGAAVLSLPRGARCFGVHISPTGEKVTHTGQVTGAARRMLKWAEPRLMMIKTTGKFDLSVVRKRIPSCGCATLCGQVHRGGTFGLFPECILTGRDHRVCVT